VKIKTQFVISMALFGLTLVIIAASVAGTSRQVSHLDEEEEAAVNIGRGAAELSYLSNDYLLYRETPKRARWESKWNAVWKGISEFTPGSPEERAIARNIKGSLRRLKSVFTDIARRLNRSGSRHTARPGRLALPGLPAPCPTPESSS